MQTRKELEAHYVEKGCLSCDSDTLQVRSAWSDSTRVIKVNRHEMNVAKRDPTVYEFKLSNPPAHSQSHFPRMVSHAPVLLATVFLSVVSNISGTVILEQCSNSAVWCTYCAVC
jgi:hypothetical protein